MATLRDVAVSAGLSPATVSRALSGARYVDDATRARVVAAAGASGTGQRLARALRAKQTMTVGLIVPDIRNDFYAETATVLQGAFEERGYRMLLCISNNEAESDRSYLSTLRNFGSMRSSTCRPRRTRARTRLCAQAHSDRRTAAPHGRGRVRCDRFDDREGAVALTSHLVALGHRRIAMIADPKRSPPRAIASPVIVR